MKASATSRSPSWRMSAGRSSDIPDSIEGRLGEKSGERLFRVSSSPGSPVMEENVDLSVSA